MNQKEWLENKNKELEKVEASLEQARKQFNEKYAEVDKQMHLLYKKINDKGDQRTILKQRFVSLISSDSRKYAEGYSHLLSPNIHDEIEKYKPETGWGAGWGADPSSDIWHIVSDEFKRLTKHFDEEINALWDERTKLADGTEGYNELLKKIEDLNNERGRLKSWIAEMKEIGRFRQWAKNVKNVDEQKKIENIAKEAKNRFMAHFKKTYLPKMIAKIQEDI